MKQKIWSILAGLFFVEAVLGGILLEQGVLAQEAGRRMIVIGLAGWLIFCIAGIWYIGKHPAHVCPHCGRSINSRNLRRNGETAACPHCGALLYSGDLH